MLFFLAACIFSKDDYTELRKEYADQDGDGEPREDYGGHDCDDADPARAPGHPELCNGIDDDCNHAVDDDAIDAGLWYPDADGDGFGAADSDGPRSCTAPDGFVATATDCDDANPDVNPDAAERCDGADDDCDGAIDEDAVDATTWYPDADGDGYGVNPGVEACDPPAGDVEDASDCDDTDPTIHPGATLLCDGVDRRCDGYASCTLGALGPTTEGDPAEALGTALATIPMEDDHDEVLAGAPGAGSGAGAAWELLADGTKYHAFAGAPGEAAGTAVAVEDLVYDDDASATSPDGLPATDGEPDLVVGAPGSATIYLLATHASDRDLTSAEAHIPGDPAVDVGMGSVLATAPELVFAGMPGAAASTCGAAWPDRDTGPAVLFGGVFYDDVVPGTAAYVRADPADEAGSAVAIFEADGFVVDDEGYTYPDVAIGAPGARHGADTDVGIVYVGLSYQAQCNDLDEETQLRGDYGDRVGSALTAGDLNGSGLDDLVVGAPGADGARDDDGGRVFVLFDDNLGTSGKIADLADAALTGPAGAGAGAALAIGDFDGDGAADDLAIGAPNFNEATGAVFVVPDVARVGTDAQLADVARRYDGPELDSLAGSSLTVGDFDGDDTDDLAVGAPGWDGGAGMVGFVLSEAFTR